MKYKELMTIQEVANLLGISRIAVYKKVKKGQIKAVRIGRNYFIKGEVVSRILGKTLSVKEKKDIESAVAKTVKEYGDTLKLLGRE